MTPVQKILAVGMMLMPLGASAAMAQTPSERALSLLVDDLQRAGYTEISVTSRLGDGYVIEAEKDTVAVVIALNGTDYSVTYSEMLTGSVGGFFATPQRPRGAGLDEPLATYATRLASAEPAAPPLLPGSVAAPDTADPRTAAFSQSQTITTTNDIAVIRRAETLGVLSPVTTETDTLTTLNGTTTHRMTSDTSYFVQQSASNVSMTGAEGFSQQIFSDPDAFRESVSVDMSGGALPVVPDSMTIIDQVVSSIETSISQMPVAGQVVVPTDLRLQIQNALTPEP